MAPKDPWAIQTRAKECAYTGHVFTNGEPYFTALFRDENSGEFSRHDYCEAAWKELQPTLTKVFSSWKSVFRIAVKPTKQPAVTQETAEQLLAQLVEQDDQATENARFILAIMLERKRILVETDTQKISNSILRIYQNKKTGEVYIIRDPNIPLSEIESIQEEVATMLKGMVNGE